MLYQCINMNLLIMFMDVGEEVRSKDMGGSINFVLSRKTEVQWNIWAFHHPILCTASGTFPSSPAESLHAEWIVGDKENVEIVRKGRMSEGETAARHIWSTLGLQSKAPRHLRGTLGHRTSPLVLGPLPTTCTSLAQGDYLMKYIMKLNIVYHF